jgi:uncharacterized protein (DUF4415 family)
MKGQTPGKASSKGDKTDWRRLASLSDKEIKSAIEADPEAHPTDANFWMKAKVTLPRPKQTITIRLDADLLGWLRQQEGYQTRINAVLRTIRRRTNHERHGSGTHRGSSTGSSNSRWQTTGI